MNERQCLIIAGEASGDALGAELVTALRAEAPWRCLAAGGPRLAAAGARLEVDMMAHAVVGLWEVLKHYPALRRLFDRLLAMARQHLPDLIVLVDYPGFNLRYAAAVKNLVRARRSHFRNWNPKIAYFVSPQLWAWRASRVRQIARDIDLMLCIFPFEQAWYGERAPGLKVEYVGHPMIDRFASRARALEAAKPGEPPLILLLPGSRARECDQHLPILISAAKVIQARHPARWRMVLPNAELARRARSAAGGLPGLEIQVGGLDESLARAKLALASSGTVTMECAFFGVPTMVLYRTSWLTYEVGKRLVRVPYIAMPNLLAGEAVYPEFIQHQAEPGRIAGEALAWLENPARCRQVQEKLAAVVKSLGGGGACGRAARAINRMWPAPP